MTEEDEAFNEIERQAKQRKESVMAAVHTLTEYQRGYEDGFIDGMQKQMQSSVDKAVNAMSQRTWGMTDTCEKHCEATAFKIVIKNLEHEVAKLKSERDEIYGLLGSAHLELRQNLEYGYNRNTIKSTLISVGQYAPKLRAKMDELQAKMGDKL